MESDGIRIVVVNGSVRPRNYTNMASSLVVDELKKQPRVSVEVLDPATLHLPLPETDSDPEGTKVLQEKVANATGVVLATPEYHGSFSSVMKLVIENLGFPSVLVSRLRPRGGVSVDWSHQVSRAPPWCLLAHRRNCSATASPVSVANVHRVFDQNGRCLDPAIEKLIRGRAAPKRRALHAGAAPT